MRKRIVSLLLALVMLLSLVPTTVFAAGDEDTGTENSGSVHVIVENNTFTVPYTGTDTDTGETVTNKPAWTGEIVNETVALTSTSTMMSCIAEALEKNGFTAVGAQKGYISKITKTVDEEKLSLGEFDAGTGGGWMGTLNDWFTNEGFASFTVANDGLQDGDEIRMMYTCKLGQDIGGDYATMDNTSLSQLSVTPAGKLSPEFPSNVTEFTLTLPAGTETFKVNAAAENKQNRIYLTLETEEGTQDYRCTAAIPAVNESTLTVRCGDTKEATYKDDQLVTPAVTATNYTIRVQVAGGDTPDPTPAATVTVNIRSQMAGGYLHDIAPAVEVASNLAEQYGFTDEVDGGVSALDVLVKAHELMLGEYFTAETARDYLVVGNTGFVTTIFGENTGNSGFTINGETPHNNVLVDDKYAPGGKSYTGYTFPQAAVKTGDTVEFFLYQDGYALDNYPLWERNGASLSSLTVKPETEVDITVNGYCIAYYGCVPMAALIEKNQVKALKGAQLAWVDANGGLTGIENAVVAEDGKVTFTAPETAGTYYLTAYMPAEEIEENYATPIIMSILPVTVDENAPDLPVPTDVTFSGIHNAQVASLKLYTYANGVKGKKDLLANTALVADGYAQKYEPVALPDGQYWVEGYDAKDNCNGGLSIYVDAEHDAFKIQRIYNFSITPSSWVLNEDYTLTATVTSADGQRLAEVGQADNYGKTVPSCIFVLGDTVEATATPNAEKHAEYLAATAKTTPEMNAELKITMVVGHGLTVHAPKGSTISAGVFRNYWTYEFVKAESVTDGEEDVTATFVLPTVSATDGYMNYNNHFVRVQNPNGVTYWDFGKWNEATEITLTAEDLHIGDSSFTKNTVNESFSNVYDVGNIYLNINSQGYKSMTRGEQYTLNVFRNWQAIESYMNAKIALPDVHYQVIGVDGSESNVVTITPDKDNSSIATMRANTNGTAIVLVTYDAMTHNQGAVHEKRGGDGKQLSAIWPEFTGVFVVTVGADGTGIQTNMTLDRLTTDPTPLDAEHDILFYTGTQGAEYSFRPEEGCTVTVARSTVGSKMSFSGFDNDNVTVAADGTVTITGLTTGRHIIKVEKNGVASYQVITARQVSYTLLDKDGNAYTEENKPKAGDTVKVQFSGLVNPKEKLCGVYNCTPALLLVGEDGTKFQTAGGGSVGTYDFSSDSARQVITITLPKYWSEETYSLSGLIMVGSLYSSRTGTQRAVQYNEGKGTYTGDKIGDNLSRLPEVAIPVSESSDFLTGTLTFKDNNGNPVTRDKLTITMKDSSGNAAVVKEDATFKAPAGMYNYTISGAGFEYATGSVTLTAEGSNTFEITLTATSANAWDGVTTTEPQKDDNGVYQISTGAELAWFVTKSKDQDISGVLTADIDLAKYAWLNVSSKKIVLDGKGYEIIGLNAQKGLFSQIGSNSHISDLTMKGTSAGGGAVTGYTNSGVVIENCFSYVTINAATSDVGGIVGKAGQNTTIRNCANYGDVTGSGNVGGIIGSFAGNGTTITGCYNTGAVTATGSNAGGIFGSSSYGVTVDNCYNTGDVTGSDAGGIGGTAKGETHWMTGAVQTAMTVTACYTTGDNAAFGKVDAAAVERSKCYSLKADDENAETLTADAELSDQFAAVCKGYPALTWQKDVSFHQTGNETVTAPTCTERGYTTHTCTHCNESYKDTYVDALGHTPGDNEVTRYPAYYTYTCDRCDAFVKQWNDERLAYVTLPEEGVTSANMADGSYPWQYNTEKNRFESTNVDQNKTTSETSFSFTVDKDLLLSFDYGVSSEAGYDMFNAVLSNGTESVAAVSNLSGTKEGTYSTALTAGTWTLTLKFKKDDASYGGDDLAYISNLTLGGANEAIYQLTGDFLAAQAKDAAPTVDFTGGEWLVLGLARSGRDVPNEDAYYQNVVAYVQEYINSNNRLDRNKSTDNSRVILALTAIGKDPASVGGYDLVKGLDGMGYISKQGTSGPVWALLALDSHDYPTYGNVTREALVDKIAEIQMESGAWYISDTKPDADIDMTAMAVQALAPYYNSSNTAKTAVDKALTWLAGRQNADGSFGDSSETNAQIVAMLCALNRDPATDSQFAPDGKSPLNALYSYYRSGGSFAHLKGGDHNQMATEQSYYAMAAYARFKANQTFLYDMTDVHSDELHTFTTWTTTTEPNCTQEGTATAACTHEGCEATATRTISALGHTMTATAAKEPTCTEAGNSAYWSCARCGKYFSDAEGKTEIEGNSWILSALGHTMTATAAKEPTCTEAGNSAYWSCARCGKYFSDAEGNAEIAKDSWIINALGHTMTATAATEPTCTEAGNSAYWNCSRCGKYFSDAEGNTVIVKDSWVIKALGHTMTATAATEPTCTKTGNSAYWTCTRCEKYFSDAQGKTEIAKDSWIINKLGHTLNWSARVEPTCYASGHEADEYCQVCGYVKSHGATIPATGRHNYENGVCTVCGIKNPTAGVKTDDIKVDNKDDKTVSGGGLVIKAEVKVDEEKMAEIKAAVEGGAIIVTVDNHNAIQPSQEDKQDDGGKSILEKAANSATNPTVKKELEKLADKLESMRGASGTKDAQLEKVVDVAVELVKTLNGQVESVAQLIELPQKITITISITDEMYDALKDRRVCVIRSHTDVNGNVVVDELPAALGGTKGSYTLSFQTDKASTFAIVSYEKAAAPVTPDEPVTPVTPDKPDKPSRNDGVIRRQPGSSADATTDGGKTVKSSDTGDNSQMTLWLSGMLLSAAALVVLTRKKKHSAK